MSRPVFNRTNTSDRVMTRVQDAISAVVSQLSSGTFVEAAQLDNVKLLAGQDNPIPHTLGRRLSAWFVMSPNAAAQVYESSTTNPIRDKQVILRTTANVTISLVVK